MLNINYEVILFSALFAGYAALFKVFSSIRHRSRRRFHQYK